MVEERARLDRGVDRQCNLGINATVQLEGGGERTFARRERPQVLLDAAGNLQCLYNAAQPCAGTWGDKCHSYTIAQCAA